MPQSDRVKTPFQPPLLAIVIADRGHVWVGEVGDHGPDVAWIKIAKARTVRRWGTLQGLNQLAVEGPLEHTILDAPADLAVRFGAVLAIIPCERSQWNV